MPKPETRSVVRNKKAFRHLFLTDHLKVVLLANPRMFEGK